VQDSILRSDVESKRNRAANAVATMLAGLVGSVLGVVAYRRGQATTEGG
jgi:hypothetical protein